SGRDDGMGEPALLAAHRCEEARWIRRALEDRRRIAIGALSSGLEPRLAAGRHQDHRRRLSSKGWLSARQLTRAPLPRRSPPGSWRIGIGDDRPEEMTVLRP